MVKFTSKMQEQVKEFHEAFSHPISDTPTIPELKRFTNRKGWGSIEEAVEQLYSISNTVEDFKLAIDSLHNFLESAKEKQLNKQFLTNKNEKLVALADGLADELYFLLGDCVETGIDIEPILNIVQNSNMSKLFVDENGNKYAKSNELGKVIKSTNFFEPEPLIKEEIQRQINNSLTK